MERRILTQLLDNGLGTPVAYILPPIDYLEYYLNMGVFIEAIASKLKLPIRIEGYKPQRDYRMKRKIISRSNLVQLENQPYFNKLCNNR